MPNSTKQQVEGKLHEVAGEAKQKTGQITGNKELEAEGLAEKVSGTVQKGLGKLEELLGK